MQSGASRSAPYGWRSESLITLLTRLAARIAQDQRGQDLSEYAIIIGLVALLVIGVVTLLGNSFSALLGAIASEVGP